MVSHTANVFWCSNNTTQFFFLFLMYYMKM